MKTRLLVLGVVLVVVGLCASSVFAVIGPPTAGLSKGQWSGGFDYSYSRQGLDTTKMKGTDNSYSVLGVLIPGDSGPIDPFRLKNKDLKTQRYYGTSGYGIDDWWELNLSLGIADVKDTSKIDEAGAQWFGINFANDFAWGWGTKITFARQDKVNWGVAVQMNWLDTSRSDTFSNGSHLYDRTMNLSTYDMLVAVGPTVDMGGWKLYGGPFYYFLNGDLDEKYTRYDSGVLRAINKESGDISEKDNFGGYIGAQFELAKNLGMTVEFSSTGGGSYGLGTGITVKF